MKMKLIFSVSVLGALLLGSCGTSNDVVGGGILQKRKYNKGFYLNRNENSGVSAKNEKSEVKDADSKEIRTAENTANESTGAGTFTAKNSFITVENSLAVSTSATQTTDKKENAFASTVGKSFGLVKNNIAEKHEVAKNFKQAMKAKTTAKSVVPGSNGNAGNILMIILLIILIIVIFSLLDSLLGGWLSWLLGIVLLVLIIYFLLRLLGIV